MVLLPPYAGLESAFVVEVPEAEPVVSGWRLRFDPAAGWGVPAHVTVLYPFVPPADISPADVERARELFGRIPAFDIWFEAVGRFGNEVLYLAPEPRSRLSELIDEAAGGWPDYPPYGGMHDVVIPHLTVADAAGRDHFDEIEADVGARMPVRSRVRRVSLMTGSLEADSWRTVEVFPLAD